MLYLARTLCKTRIRVAFKTWDPSLDADLISFLSFPITWPKEEGKTYFRQSESRFSPIIPSFLTVLYLLYPPGQDFFLHRHRIFVYTLSTLSLSLSFHSYHSIHEGLSSASLGCRHCRLHTSKWRGATPHGIYIAKTIIWFLSQDTNLSTQ